MKINYKTTVLTCYLGYVVQAIIVNFLPILFVIFNKDFNLSYARLGTLVLINFLTQMTFDFVAAKYVERIGYRKISFFANLTAFTGLLFLGIFPYFLKNAFLGLMISGICFSIGGGLIEVIISPVVDGLPKDECQSSMSLLHSFYCIGQVFVILLSTLIIKVFGYKSWQFLAIFWSLIPLFDLFLFQIVPLPPTCKGERTPVSSLFKSFGFIIALVLMVTAGASEQIIAQWASIFSQQALGISKLAGDIFGPCLFAFFMSIGRVWFGLCEEKVNIKKYLFIFSIFCIFCFLGTVFFTNPLLSLACCALTGLAVSIFWPGVLTLTSRNFPHGGATMFGILAIFGDVGCSSGPFLTGLFSDLAKKSPSILALGEKLGLSAESIALKSGIFIGIIFPLLMSVCLIITKKKK